MRLPGPTHPYGFRPGRSQHQALDALYTGLLTRKVNWVLDLDIKSFFDGISHEWLVKLVEHRIADRRVVRLIQKWLNAGVLEEGAVTTPEAGTPQGGVVSPLLANIVLHYVLDEWFEKDVRPRLKGEAFLIRYADDFVIGVAREDDARRIMKVLPQRMSKYGLTVHPEKTRLIRFEPPEAAGSEPVEAGTPAPQTFDFLGFTHYWGRSQRGAWVVKRKTAKSRLKRAFAALSDWCRENLHLPIREQHQKLAEKLQGHYGYYGIIGNYFSLQKFLEGTRRIWKRWLSRRNRDSPMPWSEFLRLERCYTLPRARVVHGLSRGAAKSC